MPLNMHWTTSPVQFLPSLRAYTKWTKTVLLCFQGYIPREDFLEAFSAVSISTWHQKLFNELWLRIQRLDSVPDSSPLVT